MATLDLVVDNIVSVLASVTGIDRVVSFTDDLNDPGVVGLVELTDEKPYVTLAGASEFLFTIYVLQLTMNQAQARRDMSVLMKRINLKFKDTAPTTADFWVIQPGTKFGGFLRNGQYYQGFSKTIIVHGDYQ